MVTWVVAAVCWSSVLPTSAQWFSNFKNVSASIEAIPITTTSHATNTFNQNRSGCRARKNLVAVAPDPARISPLRTALMAYRAHIIVTMTNTAATDRRISVTSEATNASGIGRVMFKPSSVLIPRSTPTFVTSGTCTYRGRSDGKSDILLKNPRT